MQLIIQQLIVCHVRVATTLFAKQTDKADWSVLSFIAVTGILYLSETQRKAAPLWCKSAMENVHELSSELRNWIAQGIH